MNRQAQGVVLLLLGGAILKASLTDMYLRYVKAGLQPFLIGAGALLVLAAAMTLWYDLRHGTTADTECADHADALPNGAVPADATPHNGTADPGGHDLSGSGHSHAGHREPRIGWLLIAPVLGLLLVAPPALGSYAAGQAGSALSSQQVSDFPALPDGDPAPISVLDYATRAIFDKGLSIGERRVQVTGFLSDNPAGGQLLTRMILSCCAADARPIKVGMNGSVPTGLPADSWVEITGTYTDQRGTDAVNGEDIPFIEVLEWRSIPAPAEQYE
ncbi:membrane protein [Catellatospora methionotrophica]|uniref:Membrane protein n=1 Tax=Catellatospora methionotrophica TaxID=121620 RepID=A0A8J3L9K2_9ACTN|nr:TIGR03943 family protein [Catellatospora methionotrophica]GIG16902.1 membrane protein [Catellatospora methionotrophica]